MLRFTWVTFVSLLFCLNIATAAEEGLIAYWSFDDGKGVVAKDESENGIDGQIKGVFEWVEGVVGTALLFDGLSGQVDCGADPDLAPTAQMSCMFWMRPSKDLGPELPRANIVYFARGPMFAFNKIPVGGEPDGDPGTIRVWTKGTLFTKNDTWKEGVWYHLAYTYDGKAAVLYEDGKETGRLSASGPIGERTGIFMIGRNFPGTIDEVKLYGRGLSAQEVGTEWRKVMAVEPGGKLTSTWGDIKSGL